MKVKKNKIIKVVTELTIGADITEFPTFTARTALGCILLKIPRSISLKEIIVLMTFKAPVVENEHPPMIKSINNVMIDVLLHRM